MTMSARRDGGPAFPFTETHTINSQSIPPVTKTVHYGGISMRDYFAAHAPKEPQLWFQPDAGPKPVSPDEKLILEPEPVVSVAYELQRVAASWRRDPTYDLCDYEWHWEGDESFRKIMSNYRSALASYEASWRAYWKASDDYEREYMRSKFAQWPYAWADMMLSERAK